MADEKLELEPRIGGAFGNRLIDHAVDTFRGRLRMSLTNMMQDGYMTGTVPPTRDEELAKLVPQREQLMLLAAAGDVEARRQLVRLEELS